MERIMQMFRRSRDRHVVLAMTERELADVGMSRDQALALIALPDDVPGRVAAMGRVFGLPEEALVADRNTWSELVQQCHQCRSRPDCARLMARPDEARPQAAGFCPNAPAFGAMAH